MRSPTVNRFKLNLDPEEVRSFQTVKGKMRYLKLVKGDHIESIFVGWLFESGGHFSYIKNRMKREARMGQLRVADAIALAGWPILLPGVVKWVREVKRVVIVPVPSRFGSIEQLAHHLSEMINRHSPNSSFVNTKLLSRVKDLPIKRYNWKERDKVAAKLYRINGKKLAPEFILLVDDVVSSGASLRRCSKLLHLAGARQICAATLAGDPFRKENWSS